MSKLFRTLISSLPALLILLLFGFLIFSNVGEKESKDSKPAMDIIKIEESTPLPLTIIDRNEKIASNEEIIEQEATQFVEKLASSNEPNTPIIITEKEDQFVHSDSQITLPKSRKEEINISDLSQSKDYLTYLKQKLICMNLYLHTDLILILLKA